MHGDRGDWNFRGQLSDDRIDEVCTRPDRGLGKAPDIDQLIKLSMFVLQSSAAATFGGVMFGGRADWLAGRDGMFEFEFKIGAIHIRYPKQCHAVANGQSGRDARERDAF